MAHFLWVDHKFLLPVEDLESSVRKFALDDFFSRCVAEQRHGGSNENGERDFAHSMSRQCARRVSESSDWGIYLEICTCVCFHIELTADLSLKDWSLGRASKVRALLCEHLDVILNLLLRHFQMMAF